MLNGDCNVCINGKMPSYSATCVECGLTRKNYKPITNAGRIRSMSDEELAEFCVWMCPPGSNENLTCEPERKLCSQCWLDWLRQEVSG